MALAMTDAIPLMATNGVDGINNARDIRMGLVLSLTAPEASTTTARQGVLVRRYTGTDYVDLKAIQTGSPSQAVQIFPGRAVINRSGQGPYLCMSESTATYNLDPADGSNPRYDLLYARLYDVGIGDSGAGPHGPRFEHINGTPAGSPVVPTLPSDGAIPIAAILRPAGVNTVPSANITDLRKSAALLGAIRPMLPGDALADPGLLVGERRSRFTPSALTALGAPPILVEVWGADSQWHGTQDIVVDAPTQTGSGSLPVGGNGSVIMTVVIPDPGYSYAIAASGSCGWGVIAGSVAGALFECSTTLDSTVYSTGVISKGYVLSHSISANFSQTTCHITPKKSGSQSGAKTVRLMARNSGASSYTIPATNLETALAVRIVPT